MPEIYEPQLNARLTLDAAGRVRAINHVGKPWSSEETIPRNAAIGYLRSVADTLGIPSAQLEHAHQPVDYLDPAERGTEFRLSEEKTFFDSTTQAFFQTHLNVPVWASGLTVTLKTPDRIVSAVNTSLDDLKAELPPESVIARWRGVFEASEPRAEQWTAAGVREPETSNTGSFVADLLRGNPFKRSSAKAAVAARERARRARVLSGCFYVYRYVPEERLHDAPRKPAPAPPSGFAGDEGTTPLVAGAQPTLPLPRVDSRIRPGADYLVAEIVFFYPTEEWGDINWRALVELETGSILYLRALAAHVNGLVFVTDPISKSGNSANGPASTNAVLNGFRDDETLPNLNAPVNGVQSLAGSRVLVKEKESPVVAAPTEPSGTDFDFDARTNGFAAVNAYYHVNRFFGLVEELGFPLSIYFGGTTFPVPVDHRGLAGPFCPSGNCVNAHCVGTATGIDHLCFALADTSDTANPMGIAADWRVHLHELGGHGILEDHVGSPNLGFSHSAGDSMAVILNDPDSKAPDRFLLAPFVPAVVRRHDRPVATWAFNGPNDNGNLDYSTEQMLSTTLFRVYRSIGGDSDSLDRKQFAARYMAYLILRTVGTLTPMSNPANAEAFAGAMIAADLLNWTSEGIDGGAYGKVVRWSFEKQGAYQPGAPAPGTVTAEGDPPAVDVYIDDGRGGEYQFQPNHWSTTTIWNRLAPDGGATHEPPVLGATNYAYVRIKNRGTQQAQDVVVRGYHSLPGAGLLWPSDFVAFTTPEIAVGTLEANDSEEKVVGPFEWTPNVNGYGHDCMLLIVSATDDPSNVDNFDVIWVQSGGSMPIPVPRQEVVPEWRLVPNDNNVGQRNVSLVPGGGGSSGLTDGLHGAGFWAGNPSRREAAMEVSVHLPEFLAGRGWHVGIRDLPKNRFRLGPGEKRELVLDVRPGSPFGREDVQAAADRDVVLTLHAGGAVVGGMTYRLDATLERPGHGLRQPPGEGEHCVAQAERLLDCLDVPGQDVSSVRVKKITVEISMKDEGE